MSSLTEHDAHRERYQIWLELAERALQIEVFAKTRSEAVELATRERRGWSVREVYRVIPEHLVPA